MIGVAAGFLVLLALVVWAAASEQRSRDAAWAVRYRCPGCDVRYEAAHDNRFFLPFERKFRGEEDGDG